MIVFWLHQASSDRVEVSVCARRQLRDYGDATVETNIIAASRASLFFFFRCCCSFTDDGYFVELVIMSVNYHG